MRRHAAISYFLIAFAFSWAIWIPMAHAGARAYQGSVWPTHVPGRFGPMVASFVMSAALAGRTGVVELVGRMFRLRVEAKWYLLAVSPIGFFVQLRSVRLSAATAGQMSWRLANSAAWRSSSLRWLAVPAGGGLWGRDRLAPLRLPQLLKTRSLLTTALLIGVLWALWHVPLMAVIENYRQLGMTFIPASSSE